MIPIVLMQLRNVRAQEDALAANYLGAPEHRRRFRPVAVHPICHELVFTARLTGDRPPATSLNDLASDSAALEFTGTSASNIYLQQVIVRWDATQLSPL